MKSLFILLTLVTFTFAQGLVFDAVPLGTYSRIVKDGSSVLTYRNVKTAVTKTEVALSNTATADSVYALYPYRQANLSSSYDGWPHLWIWPDKLSGTIDSVKVKCTPLNQWLVPITKARGWAQFPDNSDSTRIGPGVIADMAFPTTEGYRVDPSNLYDGKCAGWVVTVYNYGTTFTSTNTIRLIK